MNTTPLIQPSNVGGASNAIARAQDRVIWVFHAPSIDRRTMKPIDISDVKKHGTDVRVLFPVGVSTIDRYPEFARGLYDAWRDDFNDGDCVVSLGGDLATVAMCDDILRQCGVDWFVWMKHVGHGTYVEYRKDLFATDFAALDAAAAVPLASQNNTTTNHTKTPTKRKTT